MRSGDIVLCCAPDMIVSSLLDSCRHDELCCRSICSSVAVSRFSKPVHIYLFHVIRPCAFAPFDSLPTYTIFLSTVSYCSCIAIRLAYFNVVGLSGNYYHGMPSDTNMIVFGIASLALQSTHSQVLALPLLSPPLPPIPLTPRPDHSSRQGLC